MKEIRQEEAILRKYQGDELKRKKEYVQMQIRQEKQIKHSEEIIRINKLEDKKREEM